MPAFLVKFDILANRKRKMRHKGNMKEKEPVALQQRPKTGVLLKK